MARSEAYKPEPGVEWVLERQPDHFEVGLSVDRESWTWLGLDAKTWPSARKRAPVAAASLIRDFATTLRIKAGRLVARADQLDKVASDLEGGARGSR